MISIIIPTYNAQDNISDLLRDLTSQDISEYEILVIDSSSADSTIDIVKNFDVKVFNIPKREFDHGGTRTLAGKFAKGDILVYLTQDIRLYDNFAIEKLIQPLMVDTSIGVSYGRQIPYPHTNIFGKYLRLFNYPEKAYIRTIKDKSKFGLKTIFLSNSFSAYRRNALEDIGWFKKGLIFGEDAHAGARLLLKGYKIAYTPEAKVYHSHSYTIWQEFQRYFDIGVFHASENWILKEFGYAEKEGRRYIKSGIHYLIKIKKYYYIPEFLLRSVIKYIAYNLGRNYNKFSPRLCIQLSANKGWWKNQIV